MRPSTPATTSTRPQGSQPEQGYPPMSNRLVLALVSRTARSFYPRIDGFILALAVVVLAGTVLPCRGDAASAFHAAGVVAIAALFFLQGARLSREAVLR